MTTAGNGRVTSAPGGIDCGTDCEGLYADGTLVTLTAAPDPGFRFDGWSDDSTGTDHDTQVTMTADRICHATFSPAGPFTLTVALTAPPGSLGAIVGVQPAGNPINCRRGAGSVCAAAFPAGTVVVVRPSDSSLELGLFENWLGCDTVGVLFQCAVLMTGERTVTSCPLTWPSDYFALLKSKLNGPATAPEPEPSSPQLVVRSISVAVPDR